MSDMKFLVSNRQAFEAAIEKGELEVEPIASGNPFALRYSVQAREGLLLRAERASGPIDVLNDIWRQRRERVFERNIKDPRKPRIVAIGDSWFHYPFGSDLLEWFVDDWALKTFANAGDTLQRMIPAREYLDAIGEVKPHFFMLSGGGNDVLGVGPDGERNIKKMVIDNDPEASDLLSQEAHEIVAWVIQQYEKVRLDIAGLGFTGAMVVHSYDYPSPPSPGGWLSQPLTEKGYVTDADQMRAVVQIVDAFRNAVMAWAAQRPGVIFANCVGRNGRGPKYWFNEIHPTVYGFRYRLLQAFREPMDAYLRSLAAQAA